LNLSETACQILCEGIESQAGPVSTMGNKLCKCEVWHRRHYFSALCIFDYGL